MSRIPGMLHLTPTRYRKGISNHNKVIKRAQPIVCQHQILQRKYLRYVTTNEAVLIASH